jgi:pSer/pThr/pTyr-binding forkhead associated (FHA) protein
MPSNPPPPAQAYSAPPPYGTPQPPGVAGTSADGPPSYPLYLYLEGQRYEIMKSRFIIGRSRTVCDCPVNDSNVSRQHAVVEWMRGHYHIVDLGSTNGILHNGRRVERKVLREGDLIVLAGHELRFSRQ